MAIGLSETAANSLLGSLTGTYDWIQLHVGDPGGDGTSNTAGENDRMQISWGSAAGGEISSNADLEWTNVADSETYTHFSVWTAASSGTFGFSGTVTANAVTAGDDFTIEAGDLTVSLNVAS